MLQLLRKRLSKARFSFMQRVNWGVLEIPKTPKLETVAIGFKLGLPRLRIGVHPRSISMFVDTIL